MQWKKLIFSHFLHRTQINNWQLGGKHIARYKFFATVDTWDCLGQILREAHRIDTLYVVCAIVDRFWHSIEWNSQLQSLVTDVKKQQQRRQAHVNIEVMQAENIDSKCVEEKIMSSQNRCWRAVEVILSIWVWKSALKFKSNQILTLHTRDRLPSSRPITSHRNFHLAVWTWRRRLRKKVQRYFYAD